jgi:hydroxymethylpyrimidine pyrophosphatase-like HAD family hydrolase
LLALGDVKIAASEKYNIEIYHKSAGKGRALYPLAEFLGCDISEIIAVGDSKNDVEMVEEAGLGLAMSNSMEELKAIADEIICSNEEHAAKYILENYIK